MVCGRVRLRASSRYPGDAGAPSLGRPIDRRATADELSPRLARWLRSDATFYLPADVRTLSGAERPLAPNVRPTGAGWHALSRVGADLAWRSGWLMLLSATS
jgi:hypothetical protein